jgi:hypothetical protein
MLKSLSKFLQCVSNQGTGVFESVYLSKKFKTMRKKSKHNKQSHSLEETGTKTWTLQACTIKTLAEVYSVSLKVIKRHLALIATIIGKRIGHFYNVRQVLFIVNHLGIPPHIEIIFPPNYERPYDASTSFTRSE